MGGFLHDRLLLGHPSVMLILGPSVCDSVIYECREKYVEETTITDPVFTYEVRKKWSRL